ncbi:hypothetical protein DPMN_141520 [Dreissena polymorpha]|uniref:Uncharacterized protein n=1 Tax=Dreissena polymorpha TaxID=45954 RepID=A0A9D4GCT5_DREPO|nr:hypothetical protein DPMN_141520 [Dreissena polymorpha]
MDSSIVGCGYQHHILNIYLNRETNASLDSALIATLNKQNHFHYHFKYGPIKYTPLCGIMVGSQIGTQHKTATLGGFAMANEKVYALIPGHLVQMVGHFIKHIRPNGDFDCIAANTYQLQGDVDIAAAQILPGTHIVNTRFRDSAGNFTSSMLFNFEEQTEQQIRDSLQNESIFA